MMDYDHYSSETLTQDQAMALYADAQARRSKVMALLIALVAHLLLVGGLFYVVLAEPFKPEVSLIIATPYSPVEQLQPKKKDLVQLKADKPAAPSASMSKVVVSETLSAIAVPAIDEFVENPMDLGIGFGDGFGTGLGGLGSGSGAGGTFFGTPAAGKSLMLVIDVSTSMLSNCGEAGIAAIRREIERTINALQPGTRFNIICFGNLADGFASKPVPASSAAKAAAIEFMQDYYTGKFSRTRTEANIDPKTEPTYIQIRPGDYESTRGTSGGSRYDMALMAAFLQQPETIFLLTDGEPSSVRDGKTLSKKEILDYVKKASRDAYGAVKPKVNGISVNGIGREYLKDITKAFRGEYKEIEPQKMK